MKNNVTNIARESAGQTLSTTELQAAIVADSQDTIIGKTLDGIITSWNRSAERMYGYTAAEAIGQPISLIIPAYRRLEFEHIMERICCGERVETCDTERLTRTGKIIWVSLTVSPVRDSTGHVIGASAVARDISKIRKAEAALAESERRYQSLLDTAIHGIFRATLDGRFLEVNPAFVRLLGYEHRHELLALSIPVDFSVHAPAYMELVEACKNSQGGVQRDLQWKCKDGKQITVRLSAHIVFSEAQATIEAIAEDVTIQREFEQRLHRLERFELLGQLAGGVAHGFDNFLHVILAHAYALSLTATPSTAVHHHVAGIRETAEHAAEMTKRLLLLGKTEPGAAEEVDLNAVVHEVRDRLKGALPSNTVVSFGLSSRKAEVYSAATEIKHILVNLVLNARDAMPYGGQIHVMTGHSTFETPAKTLAGDYLSGTYTVLSVADTGHGMDRTTAVRALEPFFSTKPEGEGTGLGLSSVYATVKRYGGSLDIATAMGEGTRISIYLPSIPRRQGKEHAADLSRATAETVLVIGDNQSISPVLEAGLTSAGFRTVQFPAWNNAMTAYEHEAVDVVLCDLHLPDVSRPDLLQALRRCVDKSGVVVISGGDVTEEEKSGLYPGAFLQKPFSMARLLAMVRQQIDR